MEIATAVLAEARTRALDRRECTALSGPREYHQLLHTVRASLRNAGVLHGVLKDQGDAPAPTARNEPGGAKVTPLHREG